VDDGADELVSDPVVLAEEDAVDPVLVDPEVVAADDSVDPVLVEPVAVALDTEEEPDDAVPVAETVDALTLAVPVAPSMPKLGEKLMLLVSVSSMISMVYTCELTSFAGGIVRVAVSSEAGIPSAHDQQGTSVYLATQRGKQVSQDSSDLPANVIPPSGLIGSCCSLMVTVPGEGFVHWMVKSVPAVTSSVL